MNYNRVMLGGNLTRNPETRVVKDDLTVTEFGIAVNRKYKDREEVVFVDVAFFGRTGENITDHLHKGDPIFIEGRLKFDQWEKDGQKRSKLSVIGDSFQFVGRKPGDGDASLPQDERAKSVRAAAAEAQRRRPTIPQEAPPVTDDEIPF